MAADHPAPSRADTRRVTIAVAAAGLSSFALLYAPQPVLAQLASEYQLDAGSASLAISVATGALAVAVLPIAALSEVVGRRPVIVASLVCSLALGLLAPLAGSYPLLLALRALQGVAMAGVPGVSAAYLTEQLGRTGVAAAVGATVAGNTIGGMLGRLSAGLSADAVGWRGALVVVTGIALACTALAILRLPSPRRSSPSSPRTGARTVRAHTRQLLAGVRTVCREPVLLAQFAIAFLAMGAFVAMYNVIGFRLTSDPFHLAPSLASLVFGAYAVGAASSAVSGALVGRWGRRRGSIAALLIMTTGILLTLPPSLPVVVAGFVVFTAGFFATHAVANGVAAAEAPAEARGQATGMYTLAYYLGSSVGGTAGSVVYAYAGWSWLIAFVALWAGLALVASASVRPALDAR